MITALEGDEWSAARPGRNLPQKRTGAHCTGGWTGGKSRPPPGFDPPPFLSNEATIVSPLAAEFKVGNRLMSGFKALNVSRNERTEILDWLVCAYIYLEI